MNRLRHIIPLALAAMVSTSAAAASLYSWADVKDPAVPDAEIAMAGKTAHLADFKGKVVVLNLWATWCGPCRRELPTLDELEIMDGPKGLVVVPLALDKVDLATLRAKADEMSLTVPHLAQDTTGTFGRTLVQEGVPITYLIDRKGHMREVYEGATNWLEPRQKDKVEALLAEAP